VNLFLNFLSLALMIGAVVGGVKFEYDPNLCVAMGSAGVLLTLAIHVYEWRRYGFSPGRLRMILWATAMLCGVAMYYSANETTGIAFMLAFVFFALATFVAGIWVLARQTRRYLARRNRQPEGGAISFEGRSSR